MTRPILRLPVVRFLIAGAALFTLSRALGSGSRPELIAISADRIAELQAQQLLAADDVRDDTARQIEAAIDAEVLYREALARGLDVDDAVVERRLVRNMRFVAGGDDAPPAELLDRARAARLFEGDAVIRRRLVQKMKLALLREAHPEPPSEDQLRGYYAAHATELSAPPRIRLTQLFFGGPDAVRTAVGALDDLRRKRLGPSETAGVGESFITGEHLTPYSQAALTKLFGPDFATKVFSQPIAQWSGPLRSVHGAHVVWVHEKTSSGPPSFEEVRRQLKEHLFAERAQQAVREGLRRLRERYDIRVEGNG